MTINALDIFADVEKAQTYDSAQYIEPGEFVFAVERLLLRPSSRDQRVFFIAELKVVESSRDDTPVGSTRSEIIDVSRAETGPSNVKRFALALGPDLTDDDVTKEDLAALVSDEQPAAGVKLRCEAWMITTRKGNPFTKKRWAYEG